MSASPRLHTFCDDALADHDATAMANLIRRGEISAQEACHAALLRAEKMQAVINGVEYETRDKAERMAQSTTDGFFAGVPSYIKDNTDIAGVPTNHGSQAMHAPPAKRDSAFAKQYLAQGFTILGKSRLPEFGFSASTEYVGRPPVRNPWHTDYSSGASSGGSAALVAAGVVPIAHANDGGGSIRIPAAACGLVGLKPTRGRLVDGEAARALPINIIGEGIVSRSVRDTANFFTAAERYYYNRRFPAIGKVQGPGKNRLRIGIVMDSINGQATDPETRETILATARLLEKSGHSLQELPMPVPASFTQDFSLYWGMLSFMVSKLGRISMSPHFKAQETENLAQGLAKYYRENFLKTPLFLLRLKRIQAVYADIFRQYDLVLSPVTCHTTPKLGWLSAELDFDTHFNRLLNYVGFTPLNNAAGGPGISLPMGNTKEGLPIGVHFSAAHGAERTLLEVAFELEALKPFRRIQDNT